MGILRNLLDMFGKRRTCCDAYENNAKYVCKYAYSDFVVPDAGALSSALNLFPGRDIVVVRVEIEHADPVLLSARTDLLAALSVVHDKLVAADETDQHYLVIEIDKQKVDGVLSVYEIDKLVIFWADNGIIGALRALQGLLSSTSFCILEVVDGCAIFETESIKCFPVGKGPSSGVVNIEQKRKERKDKRDKVCSFANASEFWLIPEDLYIIERSHNERIAKLFDNLSLYLSLTYLCNFSVVSETGFCWKMTGYKLLAKEVNDADLIAQHNADDIFEIYKWVYNEGGISDRIGLARNIISLHSVNDDIFDIERGTIHSVKSGYEIYLKDNVKQYIELKGKISESLHKLSERASEISKNLTGSFKASLWTFVTFFVSVFLLRTLGNGNVENVVTIDVLFLSYGILLVSLMFMWGALRDLDSERKRWKSGYTTLKESYKDLLDKRDLDRILRNDQMFGEDNKYISAKRETYKWLWISSVFVLFLAVTALWYLGRSPNQNESG